MDRVLSIQAPEAPARAGVMNRLATKHTCFFYCQSNKCSLYVLFVGWCSCAPISDTKGVENQRNLAIASPITRPFGRYRTPDPPIVETWSVLEALFSLCAGTAVPADFHHQIQNRRIPMTIHDRELSKTNIERPETQTSQQGCEKLPAMKARAAKM